MFKEIVVGLDGSETSENALRIACDLGRKYGSAIHLVYAAHPETVAIPVGAVAGFHAATTMPSAAEVKAAGEKVLAAGAVVAKKYGQIIAKTHLVQGNAADRIIECADACGADLIVTGRRGLGHLTGMILGSTSQRVSHYAKCACLTVA